MTLVVGALHPAASANGRGVVEVTASVDEADDGGATARAGGDLVECRAVRPDEPGLQQEILRRVARDGQLGKDGDVTTSGFRLSIPGEDAIGVAVEITDDGVELAQRNADQRHVTRLPIDV